MRTRLIARIALIILLVSIVLPVSNDIQTAIASNSLPISSLPSSNSSPINICGPGQVISDPVNDIPLAHIDVTLLSSNLNGESLQVTFHIRDVPSQLTFDRVGVPQNYAEYVWSVFIDVDNNPQTGASSGGNWKGTEYRLSAMHYVFQPNSPIVKSIASGVQVNVWQYNAVDGSWHSISPATLNVDSQLDTMTLAGTIPGIRLGSRLVFDAYDYNPGGSSQQDTSSCRGLGHPPIVFVHGWNGLSKSCNVESNPPVSGFQQVASDLWSAGYDVTFADIKSNSCSTPPIEENVGALREAIDYAKTATGKSMVILIAHSMGGLVSRAYLESDDYKNRKDVSALYTFGTPHQGVPEDVLAFFANGASLGWYCANGQPAVCDFSIIGMSLFNRDHPSRASGVIYHVITGDAPFLTRSALGKIVDLLIPGADDGAVPTDSGNGLTGTLDRLQTDEVHATQIGSRSYFIRDGIQSWSYTTCLGPILVSKTISNCGSVTSRRPAAKTAATSLNHTPFDSGIILSGQTITRMVQSEGGSTLFATQWLTGTLAVSLVDPNNQIIDPAFAASNPGIVSHESSETLATYNFPNAIAGTWSVVLQGTSIPTSGSNFTTFAILSNSSLTLTGLTDRPWYTPGAVATITATLSVPPVSANSVAIISHSDGVTQTMNLAPLGAGQYRGTYIIPNVPGYAEARIAVNGTISGGAPFQRGVSVAFQITSNRTALNGVYIDTPEPRSPGSTLYKALVINVGINTSSIGRVGLSADLVDVGGNFVAHGVTVGDPPVGSSILTLRFDGADIFASRRNGPYRLTNLLLTDQQNVTLVISDATNVYTTAAYNSLNFAESANYFPFIRK